MPDDQPKVSVIIANRNYGSFVGEAIQSALDQDYSNVEVIVVDDGSTDHSRVAIDAFGNRINKIYREWGGQTASLNAGFAASRGQYVVFLDSDDTLCRDALSVLVGALMRDRSAAKSQGYMAVMDYWGQRTGDRIPRQFSPSGDYRAATLRRGLGACRHAWTSGNAWPRWFLVKVLPVPEDRDVGIDGYLNPVATLYGPIISTQQTVVNYRVHGRNCGPKGGTFTPASLRSIVVRVNRAQAYLASCAQQLGHQVDLDYWNRCNGNWRRYVAGHALHLMDPNMPLPVCRHMLAAPFRTTNMLPYGRYRVVIVGNYGDVTTAGGLVYRATLAGITQRRRGGVRGRRHGSGKSANRLGGRRLHPRLRAARTFGVRAHGGGRNAEFSEIPPLKIRCRCIGLRRARLLGRGGGCIRRGRRPCPPPVRDLGKPEGFRCGYNPFVACVFRKELAQRCRFPIGA